MSADLHKKKRNSWRPNKSKFTQRELGADELILTNLLADGAVWSTKAGLFVDRSIRGLTRLPSLRVRAATPRAAECIIHHHFPHSHGCLELPVQRVLQSPWPVRGMVNGTVETEDILRVRLPFIWGDASRIWHPVTLFDALPPQLADGRAALSSLSESDGGRRGASSEVCGNVGGGPLAPLVVARPFGLHPAAVAGLLADRSSITWSPPLKSSKSPLPEDT